MLALICSGGSQLFENKDMQLLSLKSYRLFAIKMFSEKRSQLGEGWVWEALFGV